LYANYLPRTDNHLPPAYPRARYRDNILELKSSAAKIPLEVVKAGLGGGFGCPSPSCLLLLVLPIKNINEDDEE
jgi:hypothetical protein